MWLGGQDSALCAPRPRYHGREGSLHAHLEYLPVYVLDKHICKSDEASLAAPLDCQPALQFAQQPNQWCGDGEKHPRSRIFKNIPKNIPKAARILWCGSCIGRVNATAVPEPGPRPAWCLCVHLKSEIGDTGGNALVRLRRITFAKWEFTLGFRCMCMCIRRIGSVWFTGCKRLQVASSRTKWSDEGLPIYNPQSNYNHKPSVLESKILRTSSFLKSHRRTTYGAAVALIVSSGFGSFSYTCLSLNYIYGKQGKHINIGKISYLGLNYLRSASRGSFRAHRGWG